MDVWEEGAPPRSPAAAAGGGGARARARAPLGRRDGNAPLPPLPPRGKGLAGGGRVGSVAAAVAEAAGTPPPQAPVPAWAFRSPAPESWAAAPSPLRSPVPPGAVASVAIPPGLHDVSLPDQSPSRAPLLACASSPSPPSSARVRAASPTLPR